MTSKLPMSLFKKSSGNQLKEWIDYKFDGGSFPYWVYLARIDELKKESL